MAKGVAAIAEAPRRQPHPLAHVHLPAHSALGAAGLPGFARHHLAVRDDLDAMDRLGGLPAHYYVHRALAGLQYGARAGALDRAENGRAVGDEGAPGLERLQPSAVAERRRHESPGARSVVVAALAAIVAGVRRAGVEREIGGTAVAGKSVDPVAGADEPVGAGAGRQLQATGQQVVPDVPLRVHPKRIEEIEGVELAQ